MGRRGRHPRVGAGVAINPGRIPDDARSAELESAIDRIARHRDAAIANLARWAAGA